jgi:hypothetical protein
MKLIWQPIPRGEKRVKFEEGPRVGCAFEPECKFAQPCKRSEWLHGCCSPSAEKDVGIFPLSFQLPLNAIDRIVGMPSWLDGNLNTQ